MGERVVAHVPAGLFTVGDICTYWQDEDLLLFLVVGGEFSWVSAEKVCSCNNVCGFSRCFSEEKTTAVE